MDGMEAERFEGFRHPQFVGIDIVSVTGVGGVAVHHREVVIDEQDAVPGVFDAAHQGMAFVEGGSTVGDRQCVALEVVVGCRRFRVVGVEVVLAVANITDHIRPAERRHSREARYRLHHLARLVDEGGGVGAVAGVSLERPGIALAEVAHLVPLRLQHHLTLLVHVAPLVVLRLKGAQTTSQGSRLFAVIAEIEVAGRRHLLAPRVDEEIAHLGVALLLGHGSQSIDKP